MSYSRRSNGQTDRQPVMIETVDPATRTATGIDFTGARLPIDISQMVGGTLHYPAPDEQWMAVRDNSQWTLEKRLPFQDPKLLYPAVPGTTVMGSSGPTVLLGSQIIVQDSDSTWRDIRETQRARFNLIAGTGTRALTAGGVFTMPFGAIDCPLGNFSLNESGDPAGTLTVKKAGRYTFRARAGLDITTAASITVTLQVGGVSFSRVSGHAVGTQPVVETGETIDLAVGQKVRMLVVSTVAGNLWEIGDYINQLTITFGV